MNFIKKWIGKVAAENLYSQPLESARSVNRMQEMLSDSGASIVAFQIENGFLVRTLRRHEDSISGRSPGFVYCADHQAIADHIVSSAVKEKLGVQQEMFSKHKQVSITSASRAAGLVGTQQANHPSY
jgi:hypothetical protein